MALTKEQEQEIRKQLLSQIEKLPQKNKEQIKQQILSLNKEQLEQFLKQNNIQITKSGQLQQSPQQSQQQETSQCIFCSIVKNQIPSHKITETNKAIAILEINPLSKGHSIIIPLEHTTLDKLPKSSLTLAQKIAKKIKLKLKPEDVKIETSSFQGHAIINVIPLYKDEKIEKKKASEQELQQLKLKLETKKRASRGPRKPKQKKSDSTTNLPQISFRIP